MNLHIYISLSGEDKIARFIMDPTTGDLSRAGDTHSASGPAPLCMDPRQKRLYVGNRASRQVTTFHVDRGTGELTSLGSVGFLADPCYLATDKTGRFLFSAHFGAGVAAVHPIDDNGLVGESPVEWRHTAPKAHWMETDASNRFAFVPHVGKSNAIFQFRFHENTGRLTPNTPPRVSGEAGQGPRHLVFHPNREIIYGDNEQGSSVTAYRFDAETGLLEPFQTLSTLPEDFSGENTTAQIRIHPDGRFLYVSNRGHDSIACFATDPRTGALKSLGQQPTEKMPRAFNLDPEGRFLFAAGLDSGRLSSYRISSDGRLELPRTFALGQGPMWVLPIIL